YGAVEQSVYLPKYRLVLVSNPQWLKRGVGDLLLERLMEDLREAQAITVSCRQYASETELLKLLESCGFAEASRVSDLRLDVTGFDVSPLRELMRRLEGFSISTFAEERERDPRCVEKLYALTTLLNQDDPARGPFVPPAYNAREALLWLEMPYVLPDAYFI